MTLIETIMLIFGWGLLFGGIKFIIKTNRGQSPGDKS